MTETSKHTQPLARGEIRRHTVGAQTFQIMHAVAGGYVQVAIRVEDEPTHVVCLEMAMDERKALATYAELIRIAELVAAPERGDSEDEDIAEPLTPEGTEALRVRAGFEPTMASETNPHPTAPGGIWDTMGTCPECGTPTGFPCVEVEIWSDGKRLQAYPHTNRLSTKPEFAASAALAKTFGGAIVDPADALPTPAPTRAEKRFADMTHGELRTLVRKLGQPVGNATWNQLATLAERAEAQGLVTQPDETTPAPTRADDVAALRAEVEAHWRDGQLPNYMATLFDRIAGAVPQPTRVWMHRCGVVLINDTEPPPCHVCVSTPQIPFVRLYSLSEIR